MNIPGNLKYTKEHEWVRIEGDKAYMGITDHAQEALGDIVFVELPEAGRIVSKGESIAVVESVKAVSNVYSGMDGEVLEINEELESSPELLNQQPYESWIAVLKVDKMEQYDELLTPEEYEELLQKEE